MIQCTVLSYVAFLVVPLLAAPAFTCKITKPRQSPDIPTAKVLNGTYSGIHSPEYNQDFFLGVPFAQPPVGDLRFRQAQSLNASWTGPKEATKYSPECIGYGSDQWVLGNDISEDCLTLNVVRPRGVNGSLPVAVWIHGGGYVEGGNADPRYNLSFIVQQSVEAGMPIIGVSINYRLSGWGFSFSKEILAAGAANIGIRDQRLALHWVHENIGGFGGDATQVTIWGESAGGFSVGLHLVAYGGRDDGLFRAAVSESGVPVGMAGLKSTPEAWQPYYDALLVATNCSTALDTLACLRLVPVGTLNYVFNNTLVAGLSYAPVIDGDFLLDSGTNLVLQGKFVRVPYLLGCNHDEGTAFATRGINTTEQFLEMLYYSGIDNATSQVIAEVYPDIPEFGIPPTLLGRPPASLAYGSQFKRVAAFIGDLDMHAPRRLTSQMWAAYNTSSYTYVFDVIPNGLDGSIGATHFQEVSFVFHNIDGVGYDTPVSKPPFAGEPESFTQLATMMSRMWISFIVHGDPNYSGVGSLKWPEYRLETPTNIVFDANVTDLAYLEPDTYRAYPIEYLLSSVLPIRKAN